MELTIGQHTYTLAPIMSAVMPVSAFNALTERLDTGERYNRILVDSVEDYIERANGKFRRIEAKRHFSVLDTTLRIAKGEERAIDDFIEQAERSISHWEEVSGAGGIIADAVQNNIAILEQMRIHLSARREINADYCRAIERYKTTLQQHLHVK